MASIIKGYALKVPVKSWIHSIPVCIKKIKRSAELKQIRRQFEDSIADGTWSKLWFTRHIPHWLSALPFAKDAHINILEIGSYEGMSARFLTWYYPHAHITCLDTFEGSAEDDKDFPRDVLELRFHDNLKQYKDRITAVKGDSRITVPQLGQDVSYDMVYVDGYHHSHYVMIDALNSWPLLKKGGIMIFDDYDWYFHEYQKHDHPKAAIALFLKLIKGNYDVLHAGYQMIIRKK